MTFGIVQIQLDVEGGCLSDMGCGLCGGSELAGQKTKLPTHLVSRPVSSQRQSEQRPDSQPGPRPKRRHRWQGLQKRTATRASRISKTDEATTPEVLAEIATLQYSIEELSFD